GAAARRKINWGSNRDTFFRDYSWGRDADFSWRASIDLWQHRNGRRRSGRGLDISNTVAERERGFLHLTEAERQDPPIREHDSGSHTTAHNRGNDCAVRQKVEKALPKDPKRSADLG